MIETSDYRISFYLNDKSIGDMVRVSTLYLAEDIESVVPYGSLVFEDTDNFFGTIQLVGGEILGVELIDKMTEDVDKYTFKVLFVERENSQTVIIHFVMHKPGFLEGKKSRAFKSKSVSDVIRHIIRNDQKEPIKKIHISTAQPITNWVQPFCSDGEFINYLKTKAYYADLYNFYAFYTLDSRFTFRSYQEAIKVDPVMPYEVADPQIDNKKYFEVMRKFGVRGYVYNIETNQFVEIFTESPSSKESAQYSLQKEQEKSRTNSVVNLGSTNNFTTTDLSKRVYHLDRDMLRFRYSIPRSFSAFKLMDTVNLTIKSKLLAQHTEISIDNFNSGIWMVGKIEKQYATSGLVNNVTFCRKGVDFSEDRVKNV